MDSFPNPLLSGFHPDPSIVAVDGVYYTVSSTFEYLPGMPVYRSTDMLEWTLIGHVATRPGQVEVAGVPTSGGVWAPTIRWRDGVFHVIVTVAFSPAGCVVFSATDPAGPWSDGIRLDINGIDPDLAWDDDGAAYVTYSALQLRGKDLGKHGGIEQLRVDLDSGRVMEAPRQLWSGTGLRFPEAPHLYRRGGWWYLLIAEGGTERGHAVSVARSRSIAGPFESCPSNPVMSARSTARPIQNTGHADMVEMADGRHVMVLLGVRPLGASSSFSPLGRETFITPVRWVDDWPIPEPVVLNPRPGVLEEKIAFSSAAVLSDKEWIAVRALPAAVGRIQDGRLLLSNGCGLDGKYPVFIGRRQRHVSASVSTRVDTADGSGGLVARYSEVAWFSLCARAENGRTMVTATASLSGVRQAWEVALPPGQVELRFDMAPPPRDFTSPGFGGGDRIRLSAACGGEQVLLTELDGRHWSSETCASFTGRVIGLYAQQGEVAFSEWCYRGWEVLPGVPLGQVAAGDAA